MKKIINSLIFVFLISIIGCGTQTEASRDLQTFEYNAAYAILHKDGSPSPDVVVPVGKVHPRAECTTGGWITHGDGHKTRCPYCDPPYVSTEEPAPVQKEAGCDGAIKGQVPPLPQPPVQQAKPVAQPAAPVKTVPKQVTQPKVKYYYNNGGRWTYYER